MIQIGQIDEHLVFYDDETDTVHCKEQTVPADILMIAYESPMDRLKLTGKLMYEREDTGYYIIGCLTIKPENAKKIYKELINIKKKKNERVKKEKPELRKR